LKKHGEETGLPVVVDFYSDSCGPCRMMAPIFKKVAAEFIDRAVFVKVDTNAQYELSSRYGIRSLPTFQWFVAGKKWNEAKGGIGEAPLRQMTDQAVTQATIENVKIDFEDLVEFYAKVDPTKSEADVKGIYQKCVMKKKTCQGGAANTLVRKLKKKYKEGPKTSKLYVGDTKSGASDGGSGGGGETAGEKPKKQRSSSTVPDLKSATKEQLMKELENPVQSCTCT